MTLLSAMPLVVMLVLEKKVFVAAVDGERDRRNAQARESSLEPIPSRERSGVSPCLTVGVAGQSVLLKDVARTLPSLPRIIRWKTR